MPGGRPSKYKPEYCEQLIEHMTGGLSFKAFAGEILINQDTIYEWARVHPEFSEAKKIGESVSRLFWEKMGRTAAAGKLKNFQQATWIFNMKSRFRGEWLENAPQDSNEPIKVCYEPRTQRKNREQKS